MPQKNKSTNSDSKQNDFFIPSDPREQQSLDHIFALLLKSFQVDFSHYRHTTILRRMSRRMTINKQYSFVEYLKYLQKDTREINILYDDLLLSFTEFFRDPHIFNTLKVKVFPLLVDGRSVRTPIRIWVPGCSTGEEVYSLAICLFEFLEETKSKVPVQFFGTDLMEKNIIKARTGIYPIKIQKNLSKKRLSRFFDLIPEGFKVIKHIREMCVFAKQDVIQDPPFPNIDLISCRNVLIYFDNDFQEKVIPLYHFSLRPEGFLLLGTSETMGRFPQFFNIIDNKANLYSKRNSEIKLAYHFPIHKKTSKLKETAVVIPSSINNKINNSEITNQINNILVDTYAPPGVLIDNNMQILQFIGHTFPYLRPESGEASLKLTKMTSDGLMPDLYILIEEAKKKKQKIRKNNISFKQNGISNKVDVSIIPISDQKPGTTNFLILFEETKTPKNTDIPDTASDDQISNEISDLKGELQSTKEYLQTIVEEKDEVNQALCASNEEVLSINEELQSVNEEMEAANEELESGNEELISLNEELQAKNAELIESKNHAENLVKTLKTNEEILRESEEQFRVLMEQSPLSIQICDINGFMIKANKAWTELWNVTDLDKVLGRFNVLTDPQVVKLGLTKGFKRVFAGEKIDFKEVQFDPKDSGLPGRVRYFNMRAYPLKNKDGSFKFIVIFNEDVTEQKLIAKTLLENENNLRALFNSMTDLVFEIDYDGKYINIAPTSPDLLFRTHENTIGKTLHEIFPKAEADIFLKFVRETIDENKTNTIEYPLIIDKKTSWFEGRATPKTKNSILFIGRDITGLKLVEKEKVKLEKQIRHSQKLETIGTLAGGIAHDFNNILTPIMGYTEMALLKLSEADPLYKDLQNVLKGTHRAKDLVEQILLFSKKTEKEREAVSLQSQIKEALKLLRPTIPATIEIKQKLDNSCPKVMADATQIHQVIVNLCTNAWQAMEDKGGILNIELKLIKIDFNFAKLHPNLKEAEYACLSIIDSGTGINKQTIERIFEPFFTTKKVNKGTGLGLSVVHGIVRSHKGDIIVYSEPEKGTAIHVYLPVIESEEKIIETKQKEILGGSEQIMIVDDEPVILEMVKTMLGNFGYKIEVFETALNAAKAFKHYPDKFDLLITDLTMPRMTGLELADQLHKKKPDFPVIIMTGFGDNLTKATQERHRIKNVIGKPILVKEITEAIRKTLNK